MATYLILNAVFMFILGVWWAIARPKINVRLVLITLLILSLFTAVFDSLIISFGIVDYNYEKTLGIQIGLAPIEDFFYALLAGLLIPAVWTILGKRYERKK